MKRLPLLLCLFGFMQASLWGAEPAPLNLLFLGDNGHHRPQERFVQLETALRARGISMKYADDASVLTKENLARFDGLVMYSNLDVISPEQEAALLEFVEGGKGFIPLHCASYCFRNSPKFVALVGAQFQKHGGEVFRVDSVAPEHPIMKGYGGFESWDETYVHTRHNEQNRIVLEERVKGMQADGKSREPWTWVRTQGQGRVFYTAWGHDQRTFGNPGFHNLVERGIRWACGQDPSAVPAFAEIKAFEPLPMQPIAKDAPKFTFVDVGPKIPNYQPSKEWGAMGKAINEMQQPLSPTDAMKHYSIPVGFELKLFAAEPDFDGKPIAMTWDERGRLWVCETLDYPNELQPPGEGRDRIRICEDTNGDGRADKFTVFADQLSIPTAIAFHRGGVIVQDGIETLYLKDTNGDDKADLREVLITGWALGDTHGGVSNFQYGLDNWIWAMQGYNNSAPVLANGERIPSFRMGFFRFHAGSNQGKTGVDALEFVRSTNNNTWGFGMSEEGLIFGSTANHNPSVFMPIANRYYERVRGWAASQLGTIADTHLFKALMEHPRQVDHHGGYTAGAGHALYTARTYPQQFWNQTAFVCEPTGHLVGTFTLTRDGADYKSTSPMNLIASDDEWAAPIMAEVGPDGNVWILDWYNYIVQHNPTPAGFKTGKGNAYESELRDKKRGRVYRVVFNSPASGGRQSPESAQNTPLSLDRPQDLVAALKRDNLFWRRHAQRLLVERGQLDVVPQLIDLVADTSQDSIGLNVGAIHALWTLHGLGAVSDAHPAVVEAVFTALKHPSAGVRRNAVQVLPVTTLATQQVVDSGLLVDADPQVKLAAYLALSDLPSTSQSAQRLATASLGQHRDGNRWIQDALISAAAHHGSAYLAQTAAALTTSSLRVTDQADCWTVVPMVSEHIARGRPDAKQVDELIAVLPSHGKLAMAILDGMTRGWPKDHAVKISPESEAELVKLFLNSQGGEKGQIAKLAPKWGSQALEKYAAEIVVELVKTAGDAKRSEAERVAAAKDLIAFQPQSNEVAGQLIGLVTPQTPTNIASQFVEALSGSSAPELPTLLIDRSTSWTPSVRSSAIRVLLGRPQTVSALLDAMEQGRLQLSDLSLDQRQALASHPDRKLQQRAQKLLKSSGGLPSADRQKVLDELVSVTQTKGDATRGKEIFKKQCAKCHVHSGEGTKIGPDLTGMAVHPKLELLVHILDPSRSVEGNFRIYTAQLSDGRVLSGMLAGESRTAIELIDTEAKRHAIPREDIEELVGSSKSLMPEGFEKQISKDEFTDLLEFLTQRGQYVPLDLHKVATVVSTKGMFFAPEGDAERMIFPDWSPKTFEGVPFTLVDPQGDRVPNAVLLYGPNGVVPPKMPKSVTLPCNMPARAVHLLSGVSGWGFPIGEKGSVSMIVRFHYADGSTEDHPLLNGEHFADYIRVVDVPQSKLAFRLRGQQLRYLAVRPDKADVISSIELVKGKDGSAPIVMAVTVESR